MTKIDFGRYLKWFRQELKLTQQQLAEKVDCALSTISRLEAGKEYPGIRLFKEFNKVFEAFGIIYDELSMENIFEFTKARKELLLAIKNGRLEEIERKLSHFRTFMEENNEEEDDEDKQYLILAHLISTRKQGLSIEEFLDGAVEVFEIRRKLPSFEDIPNVRLTQIEYEILYFMGEGYLISGNTDKAELILKGLMANRIDERSPFVRERYLEISAILAKVCLIKKDYKTVQACLGYVFSEFISNSDTRLFFNSLFLHGEICTVLGDKKGSKLVDEFVVASQNLMGYMCIKYRISRDESGRYSVR